MSRAPRSPIISDAAFVFADVIFGMTYASTTRTGAKSTMREFDVARVTVRQAMELLARGGLVSAARGRGTFVIGQPARGRGLMFETSLQALADVYRDDTPNLTLIEEAAASPCYSGECAGGRGAARLSGCGRDRRLPARLPTAVITFTSKWI